MCLVFLLSVLILLSSTLALECPSEHLIRPCRCEHRSLFCEKVIGQEIFEGVFRRLGDTKVEELILKASELTHLLASILEVNQVQRVRIIDSSLDQLFDRQPSENNAVVQLGLENVTIRSGINFSFLKSFQKLQILLVRDMEVPEIGKDFSDNLSETVRMVAFLRTKTQSIDYGFIGKSKLQDVRIQEGSLSRVTRASFPFPADSLQTLSFDGNQIEILSTDQFKKMNKLKRLTLSNNRISQVNEEVFGGIFDQLRFLIMHGNPIKCDCSIKWLTMREKEGKTITGECAAPKQLFGRNIAELMPNDISDC